MSSIEARLGHVHCLHSPLFEEHQGDMAQAEAGASPQQVSRADVPADRSLPPAQRRARPSRAGSAWLVQRTGGPLSTSEPLLSCQEQVERHEQNPGGLAKEKPERRHTGPDSPFTEIFHQGKRKMAPSKEEFFSCVFQRLWPELHSYVYAEGTILVGGWKLDHRENKGNC